MSQTTHPDFFTFFTLPRKLHLDTAALEKAFYTLSRKLHPDRFAAKPAEEQEAALAQSSLLNDAYRALKDPILRTQYLLTLEGVELEEQSKPATEAARTSGTQKKQIVPPELLEEVFGGASARSGGGVWIPMSRQAKAAGVSVHPRIFRLNYGRSFNPRRCVRRGR